MKGVSGAYICAVSIACIAQLHAGIGDTEDPLQPFLTAGPPTIVREVPSDAALVSKDIRVTRVVFHSRTVSASDGNRESEIYAVIARPAAEGRYPGLLVLHGGGGVAEFNRAMAWAKRGYVVVAPDLPGIGNIEKMPNSSGPWKDAERAQNQGRWITVPDATASTTFDSVVAGIQAFRLLQSQPDVIKERVGIVGISWGGYMTTMLCGLLGDQVKAAFCLYGSGNYDKGTVFGADLQKMPADQRETWLRYFDAGRRASNIKASYFIAAATNDIFFYPPSIHTTLSDIRSERNQVFSPNVTHEIRVPGGTSDSDGGSWTAMERIYFDYHLKGKGTPFPRVIPAFQPPSAKAGFATVSFSLANAGTVDPVMVYVSGSDQKWPKRLWEEVAATKQGDGSFQAVIPVSLNGGSDWFALVSDSRRVSVSTDILHVNP